MDLRGLISVEEYATSRGLDSNAIEDAIQTGVLNGAQIEGVWYVQPPYQGASGKDGNKPSGLLKDAATDPSWGAIYEGNSIKEQGPPPAMADSTSGAKPTWWGPDNLPAQIAFVAGLLSILLFEFWVCQLTAVMVGAIGLSEHRDLPERGGKGAAIAGIVLGLVYLVVAGRRILLW